MSAMVIADWCCKAGGAGEGYRRAGFDVVGCDIKPQPNYPFPFILGDALEILYRMLKGEKILASDGKLYGIDEFDAHHASPPCQKYSGIQNLAKARNGKYSDHPDLIAPMRYLLAETGQPYIIENVVGAPLLNPITLCGSQFGLKVYRHRLFETSLFTAAAPKHEPHHDKTPSAGNGKSPKGFISVCGSGGVRGMTSKEIVEYWSYAMDINWMTRAELAEAIPPAYTEYIGFYLTKHIQEQL